MTNVTNATVGGALAPKSTATGTILNDDAATPVTPVASIGFASTTEGNAGTTVLNFPVTLSSIAPAGGVTLIYSTADGTATAGSDYAAVTFGTVTIAAGAISGNLPVTINGDTTFEPDETFTVTITSATNATLGVATAVGTILNDDAAPPTVIVVQSVPVPVDSPWVLFALMLGVLGCAAHARSAFRGGRATPTGEGHHV